MVYVFFDDARRLKKATVASDFLPWVFYWQNLQDHDRGGMCQL